MGSVPQMNDVKARVFKVSKLTNKQSLDMLKLNAESITEHNKEIHELIEADPDYRNKLKTNIYDHELFKFLNGHPLSIVILSSLRKSMRLIEIFELLRMLKENYSEEIIDQTTLSLMLSVEASLIFARKENLVSYQVLLLMAISPSGFLKEHLVEIFGDSWNN